MAKKAESDVGNNRPAAAGAMAERRAERSDALADAESRSP
jgi:hypothetical protein